MIAGRRRLVCAAALLLPGIGPATAESEPEFHRDIAPILYENCAPCHRPGGGGPFSLLTFEEARKRGRQIVRVTRDRYMPPWLPAPDGPRFVGERRLSAEEIQLLQSWMEAGFPEGRPSPGSRPPRFDSDWQLGPPDVVLRLPRVYALPAEGVDIYRNFVVPVDVDRPRYVRAVELRPENPRLVHHARILVDRTTRSRYLEGRDPQPGFEGMELASAEPPDGVLLGWTPGKLPLDGTEGLGWRLDPVTDVVVQLHMVPSGRRESIQFELGLHFSDEPPKLQPVNLLLGSREIDIPPGATDHRVRDEYVLPVDVEVLGLYPHAHYLGKLMRLTAESPDGAASTLLHIPEWDFNWQDEYRYASPIALAAGTRLKMEFSYDNSADNVRNPNHPPIRVRYGARTADEMCELAVQVVARSDAERARLTEDYERYRVTKAIDFRKRRVARHPEDHESWAAIGSSQLYLGRPELAVAPFQEVVRLRPADPRARNNLGYALLAAGRPEEAIASFRRAVALQPDLPDAHLNLARALEARGATVEALEHFRRTTVILPDSAEAHAALGSALERVGRSGEALATMERAAELAPDSWRIVDRLAWLLATARESTLRRPARALELARRAAEMEGASEASILRTRAAALAAAGRYDEALVAIDAAVDITTDPALLGELVRESTLYRSKRPYAAP